MSAFPPNSIPIFILLCFTILFHISNVTADEETLLKDCSDETYDSGIPFEANLNNLLDDLVTSGSPDGYWSTFEGDSPDRVYGLAQCRADLSTEKCQTCLSTAKDEITGNCPNGRRATLRNDWCMLRYSDVTFSSEMTSDPTSHDLTDQIVIAGADLDPFRKNRDLLMEYLSNKASTTTAPDRYNFAKIEYVQSDFLYGAAQCTGDFSSSDCVDCLKQLYTEILSCCDGNGGATILAESCYIKYGTENFFEDISESAIEMVPPSSPGSPPPPPPPVSTTSDTKASNGNDGRKSFNILYIIVAIIASITLI